MTQRMLVLAGLGFALAGCQPAAPPPVVLPTTSAVEPGAACATALAAQEGAEASAVATTTVTTSPTGGEVTLSLDGATYLCRVDPTGSVVTIAPA